MTGIPAKMYLGGVVARTHLVALLSAVPPLVVFFMMPESVLRLLLVGTTSVLSSVLVIYAIGMNQAEQYFIRNKCRLILLHK